MEYRELKSAVSNLDFIDDGNAADEAIEEALRLLVRQMPDEEAREFTGFLPEPLSYDRLRGNRPETERLDADQFSAQLAASFGFNSHNARELTETIIRLVKRDISHRQLTKLKEKLPRHMAQLVERA